MIHLTPFLLFDGNCAEAMDFYKSCFGGALVVTKLADTPMKEHTPPALHQRVVYAHLKSDAVEFSATDWLHPTRKPIQGNTVAMYVVGEARDELQPIFDKLSAGADPNLLDALQNMPFGVYGHLADRFGVHWFFKGGTTPQS